MSNLKSAIGELVAIAKHVEAQGEFGALWEGADEITHNVIDLVAAEISEGTRQPIVVAERDGARLIVDRHGLVHITGGASVRVTEQNEMDGDALGSIRVGRHTWCWREIVDGLVACRPSLLHPVQP